MKKPYKISASTWKQHKTWMNIMKEGALTGVNAKRQKESLSIKK
jgi:hypothetical protein